MSTADTKPILTDNQQRIEMMTNEARRFQNGNIKNLPS